MASFSKEMSNSHGLLVPFQGDKPVDKPDRNFSMTPDGQFSLATYPAWDNKGDICHMSKYMIYVVPQDEAQSILGQMDHLGKRVSALEARVSSQGTNLEGLQHMFAHMIQKHDKLVELLEKTIPSDPVENTPPIPNRNPALHKKTTPAPKSKKRKGAPKGVSKGVSKRVCKMVPKGVTQVKPEKKEVPKQQQLTPTKAISPPLNDLERLFAMSISCIRHGMEDPLTDFWACVPIKIQSKQLCVVFCSVLLEKVMGHLVRILDATYPGLDSKVIEAHAKEFLRSLPQVTATTDDYINANSMCLRRIKKIFSTEESSSNRILAEEARATLFFVDVETVIGLMQRQTPSDRRLDLRRPWHRNLSLEFQQLYTQQCSVPDLFALQPEVWEKYYSCIRSHLRTSREGLNLSKPVDIGYYQ